MQELSHKLLKNISGAVVLLIVNLESKLYGITPSFDNDEFSNGITNEKWNQLITDESNLCLTDAYLDFIPWSTYKLITAYLLLNKWVLIIIKNFIVLDMSNLEIENFIVGKRRS